MTTRRKFIKGAALAAPAAALATPAIAQSKIKWRMQTYAGAALAEHVVKPAIDSFNKIAGDQMEIELVLCRPVGSDRRTFPGHAERNH